MNKYLIIIFLLIFTGCSSLGWFGSSDKKADISDGERISVLKTDNLLKADESLSKAVITIPAQKENNKWLKSSGFNNDIPENPSAAKEFDSVKYVNIGSGGSKHTHLTASPVISDDKVVTIDSKGVVTAFAIDNMKKIWRTKIKLKEQVGDFYGSGMMYAGDNIYVTTGSRYIVALDAATGNQIWQRSINSVSRSAPLVYKGMVFINTIDNRLYAIDAKDGGILWTHNGIKEDMSVFGVASPTVSNDIIYVAYSSGELYALRTIDGSEIWSDSFVSGSGDYSFADIDAAPVVNGGMVYAVSNDGVLAASDMYSGERAWEQELSAEHQPWVAGDYLFIISNKEQLAAINKKTGGIKWVVQLPEYSNQKAKSGEISWNGPIMAGGLLRVTGSNGRMLSISPENGEILYRNKIDKDVYLPPVVAYNSVFLISDGGKMAVLQGSLSNESSKK